MEHVTLHKWGNPFWNHCEDCHCISEGDVTGAGRYTALIPFTLHPPDIIRVTCTTCILHLHTSKVLLTIAGKF